MKTKIKLIRILAALLLVGTVAAGLWYARPLTIEELYPGLDLAQCVGVSVDYSTYSESAAFKNDQEHLLLEGDALSPLLALFQGRKFQRSPFFWPLTGAKAHKYQEGDFEWTVEFAFKNAPVTDFSTASGYLLHFENFFGKLEMQSSETTRRVRTADQEQWVADVLACLEAAEPSTDAKFQETLYN